MPTVYGVGSSLPWQARSTIVTASNPFDPMYFVPPGGRLDGVAGLIIYQRAGTFLCTGSLMTNNHILTAAHCVSDATGT
ncbi:MAG: trypsin-like serine protease, partial [Tepidisphaeraceae bacterium]